MATRPSAKAVGKRALRESKKIEQVLAAPRVRKPRPRPEKRFEAEEMLLRLTEMDERESLRDIQVRDLAKVVAESVAPARAVAKKQAAMEEAMDRAAAASRQPPNPLLVRVRELEERCAAAESINDARAAAHMERIERLERTIFA